MFETRLEQAIKTTANLVPKIRKEETAELIQMQTILQEIEVTLRNVISSASDNKNNFSPTVPGQPMTKLASLISKVTEAMRGFIQMNREFKKIKTEKGYFEKMGILAGGMANSLNMLINNLKNNKYDTQEKFLRDFQNLINVYISQIKSIAGLEINLLANLMKNE